MTDCFNKANDHQNYEEITVQSQYKYTKKIVDDAIEIINKIFGKNFTFQDFYSPMLGIFGNNDILRLFLLDFKKQLPENKLKIYNININNTILKKSHHEKLNKILNIFILENLESFGEFLENNFNKYPYLDEQNRIIYITNDQQKFLYNKIQELCELVKKEMVLLGISDLNYAQSPNEATGSENAGDDDVISNEATENSNVGDDDVISNEATENTNSGDDDVISDEATENTNVGDDDVISDEATENTNIGDDGVTNDLFGGIQFEKGSENFPIYTFD